MPLEEEDTLRPSLVSGSSLYGVDTASVKGDKAPESLSYDDDNGILGYKASGSLIHDGGNRLLRLSVQGFEFSELGRSCWEDVEISRAGHRKVAIQLVENKNNPQDRKKGHSLVIDLDHVLLDPLYIHSHQTLLKPRCRLRVHENAKPYLLGFEAMQDVLKFQAVFTGFSVQIHIPDVHVHLRPLRQKSMSDTGVYGTAIQLWRKVPSQHESFNVTTDAPHNQPHAWNAEEGRARSEYESSSPKADLTSHSLLNPPIMSGMEIVAVNSCVAAVVSTYKDGRNIIKQIKAKRAAKKAPAPTETLETSLQRGPPAVEEAKDQGIEKYGPRYAYSRDPITVEALRDILNDFQGTLLKYLWSAQEDDNIQDFNIMVEISDHARIRSVMVLNELYMRMAQAAPRQRELSGPSRVQTSNIVLDLPNSSAVETRASSLLVFSGEDESHNCFRLSSIPLDGRVPSTSPCWCEKSEGSCKHITFLEEIDPTSYWRDFSLRNPHRDFRAVKRSAIGFNVSRSLLPLTATLSTLGRKPDPITEDLKCVELKFRTIEDKMDFKAAYDALRRLAELDGFRRQNQPLLREGELPSNYRSPREQGSLTTEYESAAVDADNMIPTVAPKGANTITTPLYRAKAVGPPLPHSPPALAGDSSSHIGDRPDNLAFDGGRLNPKIKFDNRKRSSNISDDRQQESIRPSVEGYSRQKSLLHRSRIDDFTRDVESSFRKSLISQSRLPEYSPPKHLESPAAAAESLRTSERSDVSKTVTFEAPTCDFSSGDFSFDSEDEKRGPRPETQANRKVQLASIETSTKREQHQGIRSEHPPFSIFEHNLAKVSEPIESEPSASIVWETSGDEEQVLKSEKRVDRKVQGASIETSTKQEQWRRRICRRIVVFMMWKREQDVCIPNELWSSPASFEFINVLEMSTFDKVKGLFETYSGREWNWWPFSAPMKPLESGKVRIRWQCACGDHRWTDASKYLARKCQALVNENPTAEHERGNATSQSAGSVAGHSQIGSVVPGSFPSDASQLPGDTSNICSTAQASHIQNSSKNPSPKDLYVLFCIYQKSQILHSQILATKCQNDEAFFEDLRQEYRRLRGFFRFWFSPLQFSHCDFVKFTRFYVNELAKVGHSLPNDLIYEYNPRPPGPHDDPPISPHEFRRRFYTPFGNLCGRSEALERIPKRQKRFQVNLHVDGREDMWGLLVELQPCFLVVLMWQIAITGGGWAFMGWWLSRHHGDLQGAAMPITLIITALMALWAPIGKGMRETL